MNNTSKMCIALASWLGMAAIVWYLILWFTWEDNIVLTIFGFSFFLVSLIIATTKPTKEK